MPSAGSTPPSDAIDDVTVTARQHPFGSQLGAQDHAVNIDIEHPLCDGVGLVNRVTDRDDAGVVHQHVDGPQPVFNGVEKIGEVSPICHVESAGNRQAQPAAGLLDGRSVDIADRDLGAQTVQQRRSGQPDSARATGDSNDLLCNRHAFHRLMLLLVRARA
jgi:hypothetical protein